MKMKTGEYEKFEDLFSHPSVDKLIDSLSWKEFEDFLQYVFECAGYTVHKVSPQPKYHVDLHLYEGKMVGKPAAYVEARHYRSAHILKARVQQFSGAVDGAGGRLGYIITTSDFTKGAKQAAKDARQVKIGLMNGEMLVRYITYVQGSRVRNGQVGNGNVVKSPPLKPMYILQGDAIAKLDPLATTVLTIANSKGGVAKTTTALNLAISLSQNHEYRVLLIDMDGQTSLTEALPRPGSKPGSTPPPDTAFVSDFFNGLDQGLSPLVRPTRFQRLWLIPAHEDMVLSDLGGGAHPEEELAFVRAIHDPTLSSPDGLGFDWIIIDTPPAQTLYTRMSLAACHYVLLPANAEAFAVLGARRAMRTVRTMRALVGNGVKIMYGVVTRWKKTASAQAAINKLEDALAGERAIVFKPWIPLDNEIEKAHLQTIGGWLKHLFFKPGDAASAYGELTKGVLTYVGRSQAKVVHASTTHADSHTKGQ